MRLLSLLLIVLSLMVGCMPMSAPTSTASPLDLPSTSSSPTADPTLDTSFVFANIRVFDGEEVLPNTTVVVEKGLITTVGTEVEIPEDAQVIDGAGKTLIPGLIDAHTHIFSEDALHQELIFGVTTTMDMFMDHTLATQLRQSQADTGAVDRADLYSAGTLATAPGGHGTQFGLPIPTLMRPPTP